MKDYILPVSIIVAALMISGSVVYNASRSNLKADLGGSDNYNTGNEPADSGVSLQLNSQDVVLGDLNAPVTLVEYGDFQCPFCGRFFSQTEPAIKEEYVKTGKVKFVYRHFAFLGPESLAAAEASECAKDQGKFWQYHDEIYKEEQRDGEEHNGNLNRDLFLGIAGRLGLNEADFASCFDQKKYANKVQDDLDSARLVGVSATPTNFVNGRKIEGALPFAQFKLVIEQELTKAN